jgi:type I restriction enzyme, S subunit
VRVCLLPENLSGRAINKADCFCIRADDSRALPTFLAMRLACHSTFAELEETIHGATRPRINLGQLKGIRFGLPALDEQAEIVRRVESLFALADQLEARYTTARAHLDRLTPALLAKAFRGDLVPQDAGDTSENPASSKYGRVEPLSRKAKSERQRR